MAVHLRCRLVVMYGPAARESADVLLRMVRRFQASIAVQAVAWEVRPGDALQNAPAELFTLDRVFVCLSGTQEDEALRRICDNAFTDTLRDKTAVVSARDPGWGMCCVRITHDEIRRSLVHASSKMPR